MIPDMGPHAAFIWSAYGITTAVIAGLIVWLIIDGQRYARALASLEARGGVRRPKDI